MVFSGNTPMVEIIYRYNEEELSIFAKLESFNPTGSIKDRIAEYILGKASAKGELKDGQPVIEVTSGNTGIAFAALGAQTGHPVHIFMPDWASEERKRLMQMYGAELHLVSKEEGGFIGAFGRAKNLAEEIGAYLPLQFENKSNKEAHYFGTGAEILRQLPGATDFVSGIGTGGTLMGIGSILKEKNNAAITAIEPDAMQLLSGMQKCGSHKIEGIGDDFIPALVNRALIDNVYPINDDDAIIMAARLAKELGLGVGISSGANFLGCVLQNKKGKTMVTVFPDDNKKYLSTGLLNPPKETSSMINPKIELVGVRRIA